MCIKRFGYGLITALSGFVTRVSLSGRRGLQIPCERRVFGYGLIFMLLTAVPLYADVSDPKAVVGTVAADYSVYAHSVVDVDPPGGPRTVLNELLPTASNVTLSAYAGHFYRIERMNADNVAKFHVSDPETPIWQYSTLDSPDETTGNPGDMVFAGPEKAYILRYGKRTAWVVDPQAQTEAGFKTGVLDLGAYGDQDEIPEMQSGVVVDNKLFILLQRLDRNNEWIPNTAYVAVFDTNRDVEIDTGKDAAIGVKGIPLPVKNPLAAQYVEADGYIYIQGVGKYGSSWSGVPAMYDGGVARLDPNTYTVEMVVDDGNEFNHPYGLISGMVVVSPSKGYFVGYNGWEDNTVYIFNPATGEIGGSVPALSNKAIAGMEGGLHPDKNGMVWICNQTDARIDILNPNSDTIDESVYTSLNPLQVVFADAASGTDPGTGTGSGNDDDDDDDNCFINSSGFGIR